MRRALCTVVAGVAALFADTRTIKAELIISGPVKLMPFDYSGVRLLDSHWQDQQQGVLEYYLSIPTDDYLIGFRKRAGRAAPGSEFGGWYSNDIFNPFGQIVSGLSRLYAATGDPRVKLKVDELVSGFVECIEEDGFHFYSRNTNAPHYEYDKFLGGLIDAYLYCGNADAKAAISPITDWAVKNLDRDPVYPQPPGQANVEGYTLTENLYRAHLLTGEAKYREFGEHWEYWAWWNKFEDATPEDLYIQPSGNKIPHYHAYSHVNALNGLAAGFLVTEDQKYLSRLQNAYDYLLENQTYVTGGYGPMERITHREFLKSALDWSHRHFETQCGSWAVLKLCKYLQSLTGDSRYADWAELMLYNGIGGSIQMDREGRVQYFSNYSSRGARKININPWSCCTGTRPQAVADYTDQIYFRKGADIYVSLFVPSSLTWDAGSTASLQMHTAFPADEKVRIVMQDAPATSFTLYVRRPSWITSDMEFQVNGQTIESEVTHNGWYPVSRTWNSGDELVFGLPAKLEWKPFNPGQPFPGAVTYGPVALAWLGDSQIPAHGKSPQQLIGALQRKPGNTLLWTVNGERETLVKPWYLINASEKYHLYLDPGAGQYVDLGNGWRTNENHMISDLPGAEARFSFEGTGVRVHYSEFDDAGIAEVHVDGKLHGVIDQFGPHRDVDAHQDFTGLPKGHHTVTIVCSGEKNADSKAKVINIQRFEVLGNPE